MTDSLQTPLHRYVSAFNSRDTEAMAKVFSPNLQTIHPSEPEVDVTHADPFLIRMRSLWDKGIHYRILRTISRGDANQEGEVWGEILALDADNSPLASEVVIYQVRGGLVSEICVYKQMRPSHPAYRS